jgi:hypothetical protein
MKTTLKVFTILILISGFVFCSKENRKVKQKASRWLGDTLELPEVNQVLYKDSLYNKKQKLINENSKLKVITLIWGECQSCVKDLKKWNEFFEFVRAKSDVEMYFYLNIQDIRFFKKNYYHNDFFKYPLILDKNLNYINKNDLPFKNKVYQTFLLNSKNKVILIGNPIYNDKLMKLYKKEINKRLN